MSKQEFSRLDVLLRVQSGRLRVADACALMGLHRRQVFRLLRGLKQDGAPVAFYSDKHGIFRVNAKDAVGGDRITQFGRALMDLNIDIICANSPQAKGRIERAFGTLQDRMVKELRLAGISTVAAANAWLPGFIAGYNARFGRQPANAKDLHRPLTAADNLDEILTWREVRTVTNNLTLHYDRMMLLLNPTPFARGLARKRVGWHARRSMW